MVFFQVIGRGDACSHTWLKSSIQEWENCCDYKKFRDFIHNIDVVNDRAECGIKLIQEYIGSAHCESDLQDLLNVVDNEKSKLPNLNKVLSLTPFYLTITLSFQNILSLISDILPPQN